MKQYSHVRIRQTAVLQPCSTHSNHIAPSTPDVHTALNLAEPPDATVMHVSVRSFAPTSNEDLKKPKKRGSRRGRSSSGADGAAATGPRGEDDEDDGAGGCCSGCVIC